MWGSILGLLGMVLGSVPDVRHRCDEKVTAHVLEFDILGLQNKTQEHLKLKNKLLNNSKLKDKFVKKILKILRTE